MRKSLPLFTAIFEKDDHKFFDLVAIENYSLEEVDPSGRNLLLNAILESLPRVIDFLIQNSNLMNRVDNKGWGVLHYAGYKNDVVLAEKLIKHVSEIDLTDNFGNTPLWRSVFEENQEAAEFFVGHGADVHKRNLHGVSPLAFAQKVNNQILIEILTA